MKGNNTQSKEGFINSLGHPRKKELAEVLMTEGVTLEEVKALQFDRISVMEMVREISRNIEGMEDFSFDYPRETAAVAEEAATETPSEGADTAQTTDAPNATEGDVQAGQDQVAPTATDDTPVNPEADVRNIADAPAAPEATETPAAPAAPAQPQG